MHIPPVYPAWPSHTSTLGSKYVMYTSVPMWDPEITYYECNQIRDMYECRVRIIKSVVKFFHHEDSLSLI